MFNESGIKEFRNSIPDHFRARRSNFFILLGTLILSSMVENRRIFA